jgi:hypothetical protein
MLNWGRGMGSLSPAYHSAAQVVAIENEGDGEDAGKEHPEQ